MSVVGINCDNSGTPEQGLHVLRRNGSFVRKNGDSWRSINTDESTGRLFGRGTHANPRLWFTHALRKFVRPIPKTERSWGKKLGHAPKTLFCEESDKQRRRRRRRRRAPCTPKGPRRVQRPGATINVWRDSNNKVMKKPLSIRVRRPIQTIPSNSISSFQNESAHNVPNPIS